MTKPTVVLCTYRKTRGVVVSECTASMPNDAPDPNSKKGFFSNFRYIDVFLKLEPNGSDSSTLNANEQALSISTLAMINKGTLTLLTLTQQYQPGKINMY